MLHNKRHYNPIIISTYLIESAQYSGQVFPINHNKLTIIVLSSCIYNTIHCQSQMSFTSALFNVFVVTFSRSLCLHLLHNFIVMNWFLFLVFDVFVHTFQGDQRGLESWFQDRFGGSNEKNFPGSLSLSMTPCNTRLIFTLKTGTIVRQPGSGRIVRIRRVAVKDLVLS